MRTPTPLPHPLPMFAWGGPKDSRGGRRGGASCRPPARLRRLQGWGLVFYFDNRVNRIKNGMRVLIGCQIILTFAYEY